MFSERLTYKDGDCKTLLIDEIISNDLKELSSVVNNYTRTKPNDNKPSHNNLKDN